MFYSVFAPLVFLMLMGLVAGAVVLLVYLLNLARDVKELRRRLSGLEAFIAAGPESVHRPEHPQVPPQASRLVRPPAPPPPPAVPPAGAPKKPEWNLEALIGGKWLNRIGVVLVIFGVAFFLKYAFDNRWIGETGRVIIGFMAGLIFVGLGEWYQRKDYRYFSQGLTGGGIGILYLSIYAAFGLYQLIPLGAAFVFMILATAASVTLAVWYGAISIAALATLGGFLTPFLLSTGVDNQATLFTYIFFLNAGILGVAYFRNWPVLNYQSFILTVVTFAVWAGTYYKPEKLWPTFLFLTLLFAVFAVLAILYNIVNRRIASPPELILAFLNAGIYFGASYFLLEKKYGDYLGLFSLAMGGAYVALAYLTNLRHRDDRFLVWIFLGLAATFVTLAVPIQLKQNWITVGWAVEGAILAYIGFRYDSRNTRWAAIAILALVLFRLLFFDLSLPRQFVKEEFVLLFNTRVFSYVFGIAAMLVAAYFLADKHGEVHAPAKFAAGSLLIAANLLAIVLLSAEAHDYFEYLRYQDRISRSVLAYAQQLSLSIVWAIYAAFLIVVGIWKGYKPMRYMALLLFAITILKVFIVDLSALARFYRIISFVALGIILIAVSLLYQKYREILIGPSSAEGKTQ